MADALANVIAVFSSSTQPPRPGRRAHWRRGPSTLACLQTNADFAGFIIGEVNAGLFKDFLYLEDRREIALHNAFILLDPLKCR